VKALDITRRFGGDITIFVFLTVSATVSRYWPLLAVTGHYFLIFEFKIAWFVLNTLPTHPQSHLQF
jgi:hypothetical protein